MFVYSDRLGHTLMELVRIPSLSGHEEYIRSYLERQLLSLGLHPLVDDAGNLIATLPGAGRSILLNAHMDRVPPGLGHEPILNNGVLYSDGSTNLGADDVAGITIILEVLRRVIEQDLPHPPLVVVFTVQEEAGRQGAANFDATAWDVSEGIVFDNAFDAGIVVSHGAAYEAFEVTITGQPGHSGKDLTGTVDALEIFRQTRYPHGPQSGDLTRIHIGRVIAGTARNSVPGTVLVEGEIRSFEQPEIYQEYKQALTMAFAETAQNLGGRAETTFTLCANSYVVSPDEPLLQTYQAALAQRGATLQMQPTLIGSDANAFRPAIRAFTVSTGVVNEHTVEEHIALAPLEQLVTDTLQILHLWHKKTSE